VPDIRRLADLGADRAGPDRYGADAIADFRLKRGPAKVDVVPAEAGLVVEDAASGFTGAVVRFAPGLVELEDRHGAVRSFPLGRGFLIDGVGVELGRPAPSAASGGPARAASGSLAVAHQRARVALPSRIFVEGRHDAELVERVWGDDLRVEGVVVEYLEGVDRLEGVLREFAPTSGRRAGVLLDHLVPGSKESRVADAVARGPFGAQVLVVGHPFVDIWQAVKPASVGIPAWPVVDRGSSWKHGVCQALGWPHADQADIARAWQRILSQVRSFGDLEPALLGRVEQLIDFVTVD
jgi:hypothetical protein